MCVGRMHNVTIHKFFWHWFVEECAVIYRVSLFEQFVYALFYQRELNHSLFPKPCFIIVRRPLTGSLNRYHTVVRC